MPAAEVVVVDSSTDGTANRVASEFPEVRLFHLDRRQYPGEARNYGVEQTHGDVLVFLDADCQVPPDWLARVVDAHHRVDVIGSAIVNKNPESHIGWVHYLFEFSQWLPAGAPRFMEDIAGGGLSIKRAIFERYGPFPVGMHSQDTGLVWRLRQAGIQLWFDPAICVFHRHETALGSLLMSRFERGRHFATIRVREQRIGWMRRSFLIVGTPLLPFVLFTRGARRIWKVREFRGRFLRIWPLVFLTWCAWSCGELAGYLKPVRA